MAAATTPIDDLKGLEAKANRLEESVSKLTKSLEAVCDRLSKIPDRTGPTPEQVFGTPGIRRGEDAMSSRGFSFAKMVGLITGAVPKEQAKVELDVHSRLHNAYGDQYEYKGGGHAGINKFLAPLGTAYMEEDIVPRNFRHEMKSLVRAGIDGSMDMPDEMQWIKRKMLEQAGYGKKDLSWLDEFRGGALVPPPEYGELIELLRSKEALVNAGARVFPLPAQGRLKLPRQTAASLTYWVGENKSITSSDIGTGEVTLQAKKLAVLIKTPNELIRFASPAAEQLLRDDMTKSLALGFDLACLEGTGTDVQPRGLINMPGITTITSTKPNANGDELVGNDLYRFLSAMGEVNAEAEGFILRPKTLYKYYQLRADAIGQGDKQGMFLFNAIREPGAGTKPMLAGLPVTTSTQVSQVRSKGTSSNLTYIFCGMWSDAILGMFGAIEFAATALGDTAFQFDQTWIRGILSCDFNVRHEAAFCLMDNLDVVNL